MSSPFIERSKHAAMTAAVESHFGGNGHRATPGTDSGKGFAPGGTDAWNGQTADTGMIQRGQVNRTPSGANVGASQFNATSPQMEEGAGYGYVPISQAGHTVKDDPFEGWADGMPGDSRKLWRK
jgi:hypothetical protein